MQPSTSTPSSIEATYTKMNDCLRVLNLHWQEKINKTPHGNDYFLSLFLHCVSLLNE